MFTKILDRIQPRITKQDTNWRKPLDQGLKLLCALTYLSGGVTYRHRMFSNRLPHNSLSIVVREVCTAIHEQYETEVVKCPSTPDMKSERQLQMDFNVDGNSPIAWEQ